MNSEYNPKAGKSPSGKVYGMSANIVGIYTITCLVNGRQYVGSSNNIPDRWRTHRKRLESEVHPAKELLADWKEFGPANFKFVVLYRVPDTTTEDDLLTLEQQYIDELKPVYNTAQVAGSIFGYKHTEEAKEKMRGVRGKRQDKTLIELDRNGGN